MEKENFKNKILKQKFSILIIIILLIIVVVLFGQKQNYKYILFYQYQAIPHIELKNTLHQTQDGFLGEVSGFVKFDNIEDQPKDVRQYYIIKSSEYFKESQLQHFSLEEIIKMNSLSPKSLGTSLLYEIDETDKVINLVDENGNQFFINKITKVVTVKDVNGNSVVLITNDSDYEEFMEDLLLKK